MQRLHGNLIAVKFDLSVMTTHNTDDQALLFVCGENFVNLAPIKEDIEGLPTPFGIARIILQGADTHDQARTTAIEFPPPFIVPALVSMFSTVA